MGDGLRVVIVFKVAICEVTKTVMPHICFE